MQIDSIKCVTTQLIGVSERILGMLPGIENSPNLRQVYEDIFLDEVKHIQILTLELTKLVDVEGRADDGSVFAEGDLESVSDNDRGQPKC